MPSKSRKVDYILTFIPREKYKSEEEMAQLRKTLLSVTGKELTIFHKIINVKSESEGMKLGCVFGVDYTDERLTTKDFITNIPIQYSVFRIIRSEDFPRGVFLDPIEDYCKEFKTGGKLMINCINPYHYVKTTFDWYK